MTSHVIRNLLHDLFENNKNEALGSFYPFPIISVINSGVCDHENIVLFISLWWVMRQKTKKLLFVFVKARTP